MSTTTTIDTGIAAAPARPVGKAARFAGIDRLRGLVMIVMALDHARDFVERDAPFFSPTDAIHTNLALFLTRFVTHYCAPTFILLAGLSAGLMSVRLNDRGRLAGFLASRGVWLMLLELTIVDFAWFFSPSYKMLQVIWVIGLAMLVLAGLQALGRRAVLAIGLVLIGGHNLLDGVRAADWGDEAFLWEVLHEPGDLPWGIHGIMGYPLLPWLGVMCLGFGLADHYRLDPAERQRRFTLYGAAMVAAFFAVRAVDGYGDPVPWVTLPETERTLFSFFDVTKYPPSLCYLLITLGPALILLPRLERLGGAVGGVLEIYGRVPLFYYVLHLFLFHLVGVTLPRLYGLAPDMLTFVGPAPDPATETWRLGLPATYVVWIAGVAALYPACRWFAGVKARRRDWWLSYL